MSAVMTPVVHRDTAFPRQPQSWPQATLPTAQGGHGKQLVRIDRQAAQCQEAAWG